MFITRKLITFLSYVNGAGRKHSDAIYVLTLWEVNFYVGQIFWLS